MVSVASMVALNAKLVIILMMEFVANAVLRFQDALIVPMFITVFHAAMIS